MQALDAYSCLKTKLTRLITWVIQSHQILIMPSLTWKSFQSNSYQINISPSFMWSCPLWLKIPIISQKFYSHHSFKLLETQFRKIGILPPTWAPANCPQPNKTLPQATITLGFDSACRIWAVQLSSRPNLDIGPTLGSLLVASPMASMRLNTIKHINPKLQLYVYVQFTTFSFK